MSYRGGYPRGGDRSNTPRTNFGGAPPNKSNFPPRREAPQGSDPRERRDAICGNPQCRERGHYAADCTKVDAEGYTNGCGYCNNWRVNDGHSLHQCPIFKDGKLTVPTVKQYLLRKRDNKPPARFDRDLQEFKDFCPGYRPWTRETAQKIIIFGVERKTLLSLHPGEPPRYFDPAWSNGTRQIHPNDITATPRPIENYPAPASTRDRDNRGPNSRFPVNQRPAQSFPDQRNFSNSASFRANSQNSRQFAPAFNISTQTEVERLQSEVVTLSKALADQALNLTQALADQAQRYEEQIEQLKASYKQSQPAGDKRKAMHDHPDGGPMPKRFKQE
ncbi:hypothetical protein NHQ30_007230 [Ciborinia camelliae]|nr:hypothetical protein NHQ30_007230 [Ciborinia camelliae]